MAIPGFENITQSQQSMSNKFMAAMMWALRNDCDCEACNRLRKAAEYFEQMGDE